MNKLLTIIPAFNEESNIEKVLIKKKDFFDICVVDDNSSDRTKEICKKYDVILLSNRENIGYEKSIKLAFDKYKLKYDYILTCDADNELDLNYALNIFTFIKENNFDLVVCNRDKFNRFSERMLSKMFSMKFNIKDPLSGMKMYATKEFLELEFDTGRNIGVELLVKALKNNMKVSNYAIKTKKRVGSSKYGSKIGTEFKILYKIIRLCYS